MLRKGWKRYPFIPLVFLDERNKRYSVQARPRCNAVEAGIYPKKIKYKTGMNSRIISIRNNCIYIFPSYWFM
jgi:hypothetical protein